jgi:hypothetical protein
MELWLSSVPRKKGSKLWIWRKLSVHASAGTFVCPHNWGGSFIVPISSVKCNESFYVWYGYNHNKKNLLCKQVCANHP